MNVNDLNDRRMAVDLIKASIHFYEPFSLFQISRFMGALSSGFSEKEVRAALLFKNNNFLRVVLRYDSSKPTELALNF